MITRGVSLGTLFVALAGCFLAPGYGEPSSPPPVRLDSGSNTLEVEPYTTCWSAGGSGYCADGMPADPLPDLGRVSGDVTVTFAVDDWELKASALPIGGGRTRPLDLELDEVGGRTWELGTDVPDGTYEVHLSGRGPEGDIAAAFQLTAAGA